MYPKLVTVSQGPCSKGPGLPQSDPLLGLVVGLRGEETVGIEAYKGGSHDPLTRIETRVIPQWTID